MSRDSLDVRRKRRNIDNLQKPFFVLAAFFSYLTISKIGTRCSYNERPFSFCLDSRKFLNFVLK